MRTLRLIALIAALIFLFGCNNNRINILELQNKQLKQSNDCLIYIVNKNKQEAIEQRERADSASAVAHQFEIEAVRQKIIVDKLSKKIGEK